MKQANPAYLIGFLMTLLVVLGGVAVAKGGLYVGKHEGDTLHLLQILFRMEAGEWPHLDFTTPIGALAFAPISLFMKLGMGVGTAFIWAQILVALVMLPMIFWAAHSRLVGPLAYIFSALVLGMILALTFGLAQQSNSVSMHYNRWAWALSFTVLVVAVLPALTHQKTKLDGICIGICMTALAMIKVTYFAAFAPVVVVGLLVHKAYRTLAISVVFGLVLTAVITVFVGVGFWQAYLADVLEVASSEFRSYPSQSFWATVIGPAYIVGSVLAVFGAVMLRGTSNKRGGLLLIILVPAFFYVTYQNYGNDPLWLPVYAVILLAMLPIHSLFAGQGGAVEKTLGLSAIAAGVLAAPLYVNLTYSPISHYFTDTSIYSALIPQPEKHSDLQVVSLRGFRVDGRVVMNGAQTGIAVYDGPYANTDMGEIQGEPLPNCSLKLGMVAWFTTMTNDLEAAGLAAGKRLFVTDVFASHWMFSSFKPLLNGAPWYYGGLPGFESADYVLVPLCPVHTGLRKALVEKIEALDGVTLSEIHRSPLYILYDINRL